MSPDHESAFGGASRPIRWLQVLVIGLPLIALSLLAWHYRSVFDDGYIYLHVVQQILAGHGPVFSQGQRVEAFTGPLWVFVLAVGGLITPFRLDWIAVVMGMAFTVGGLALAMTWAARLVRRVEPAAFLIPVGAIVFVAVSPVWTLATMGLETGLSFAWLALCFALFIDWATHDVRPVRRVGLVVLGLGPLVRPELMLDSMVFIAVVIWAGGSITWRTVVRAIAWAAAIPLAYEIFRMGYYGTLVANTAIAKEGAMPRLGQGVAYLEDFVGTYWLFVPAIALLIGAFIPLAIGIRKSGDSARTMGAFVALPCAALMNIAYITALGGDYIHARLLAPAFFALCVPVAIVPLTRRFLASLVVIPWAVIASISLRPPSISAFTASRPFLFPPNPGMVTVSDSSIHQVYSKVNWYSGPGLYTGSNTLPESISRIRIRASSGTRLPTVILSGIGLWSYASGVDVTVYDRLGLSNPLAAHLLLTRRGLTGHEKKIPTAWIAAQLTAPGSSTAPFDRFESVGENWVYAPLAPDVTGRALAIETAWARAALTCPAVHDLVYSPMQQLSVGSFASNMVHAFDRTMLRVPADPESAYHAFCGKGTPRRVVESERA